MARKIKPEEYAAKRREILDSAQRLLNTKGYGQMSIQDILKDLQISKGAFYHYFDSKAALLDALVERITLEVESVLTPIVEDPSLPAIEKLQRYFDTASRWKTDRKALMLALLAVWYADENALFRQKQTAAAFKQTAPAVAAILRQGVAEAVFSTTDPELSSEIVLALLASLGDTTAQLLLADDLRPATQQRFERAAAAYNEALERLLGAPRGSLQVIDPETLGEWVVARGESRDGPGKGGPVSSGAAASPVPPERGEE